MIKLMAIFFLVYPLLWVLIDGKLRKCPPGTIPYELDNFCCHPVYDCVENTSVARCKEDKGNETCEICPGKMVLAFHSSSFDRKECYSNACPTNPRKPEEVAIDSNTCVCKWVSNMVHKRPETSMPIKSLNCQFRSKKCQEGFEPNLTEDNCLPCKPGFYKAEPHNNSLCKAWTNCTLMGYRVKTAGDSQQNEECDEEIPSSPIAPTTVKPETTTSSDPTTATTATPDTPTTRSTKEDTSKADLIAGVTIAVLLIFILIFVILCCKYRLWMRIYEWCQRRHKKTAQNGQIRLQETGEDQSLLRVSESGPGTMETNLDSNEFPSSIKMPNGVDKHLSNGDIPSQVSIPRSATNGGCSQDNQRVIDTTGAFVNERIFKFEDETKESCKIESDPKSNGDVRGMPKVIGPKEIPDVKDCSGKVLDGSVRPRVTARKVDPDMKLSINDHSASSSTQRESQDENPTMPVRVGPDRQGTSLEVQPDSGINIDLVSTVDHTGDLVCRTPPEGAESSSRGHDETFDFSNQTPLKRVNIGQNHTQVKSPVLDPDNTSVKTGQSVSPLGNTVDPRSPELNPMGEIGNSEGKNSRSRDPNRPSGSNADPDTTIVKTGPSVSQVDESDPKEEEGVFRETPRTRYEQDRSETAESDSMINPELPSVNNLSEVDEQTLLKLRNLAPDMTPQDSGTSSLRPEDSLEVPNGSGTRPFLADNKSGPILRAPVANEQLRRTVSLPEGPTIGCTRPIATVTPQRNLSCEETGRQPEENSESMSPSYSNGYAAHHGPRASVSPLPSATFPPLRDGGSVSGTDSSQPSSR